MTQKDIIISIENVDRIYVDKDQGTEVKALQNINFDVHRGEFISLIGPSGCGKTTLLRLLAGLDKPQAGKLCLNGSEISGPNPKQGYVFQQGSLFPWMTIEENVAAGLKARHIYRENKHKVGEYLELVGLSDFKHAFPHQVSGGMAQRAAIIRSLINDPEVLLLDEPMGALDSFTRADLQQKLLEIQQRSNTTMILVTHDIDEAIFLSDRIVVMTPRPGKISEVLTLDFPKPRERNSGEFAAFRSKLLEEFNLANRMSELEYTI